MPDALMKTPTKPTLRAFSGLHDLARAAEFYFENFFKKVLITPMDDKNPLYGTPMSGNGFQVYEYQHSPSVYPKTNLVMKNEMHSMKY